MRGTSSNTSLYVSEMETMVENVKWIVRALKHCRDQNFKPFTVMSCDRVPPNGVVARNTTVYLARVVDEELADWVIGKESWFHPRYFEIWAKPSQRTLEEVFVEYEYALFAVFLCGGFGCCPTVATSNTMYAIGAGDPAPQYGSVLLLLIFYFTDFAIVRFIPKSAFSSLGVGGRGYHCYLVHSAISKDGKLD
ncbi:mannonate oxidoreductase [Nitzschia inconspicua]|uniref:Mannonate oxidoreductase n=1 Tax=Nitzschia inconspicua TaxID=303405 RepID=A0A9K3PC45_9STRA|nr:mannonate oxidoreductase [Nitzschia inconspicua]